MYWNHFKKDIYICMISHWEGRAALRQRRTESSSITIKFWFSCIWSNQQWQLVLSTSAFIHQKLTRLFEFNWLVELWWQKPITRNLTMYPMADLWHNLSPIRLNCCYRFLSHREITVLYIWKMHSWIILN